MNPIRVVVIGAGHLGRIHTRLLLQQKGVKVVGVADPSPIARQQIAEEFGVPVFSDFRALERQMDAAVVATPTRSHFEVASELIQRQVHLLIEKPLTDSASTAQTLVELADRRRCTIQVGHVERFNPALIEALKHIGQPKLVVGNRLSSYTFRSTDIGVVNDLMIHDIDLVNSMFQGGLVETRAVGMSILGGHEDLAQARLQFRCGGVANLTASRCSYKNERTLQLFGTEGFAAVDLASGTATVVEIPEPIRNRQIDFQNITSTEQAYIRAHLFDKVLPKRQIEVEKSNAILLEQEDWLEAIRFGTSPKVSISAGSQAVQIAQDVLDSLARHRWSQAEPASTGPFAITPQPSRATADISVRKAA